MKNSTTHSTHFAVNVKKPNPKPSDLLHQTAEALQTPQIAQIEKRHDYTP